MSLKKITSKKDFDGIFRGGKSARGPYLVVKYRKREAGSESRCAFMVSQKVSKKAVIRNKIRRRLSEITREVLEKSDPRYDLVFVVLPGMEQRTFDQVREAVEGVFTKIRN